MNNVNKPVKEIREEWLMQKGRWAVKDNTEDGIVAGNWERDRGSAQRALTVQVSRKTLEMQMDEQTWELELRAWTCLC